MRSSRSTALFYRRENRDTKRWSSYLHYEGQLVVRGKTAKIQGPCCLVSCFFFFYPIVQFSGVSTFVRLKFENLPVTIYILELRWVISQDGDVPATLWCYLASISLIPSNECITIKFSHESFDKQWKAFMVHFRLFCFPS